MNALVAAPTLSRALVAPRLASRASARRAVAPRPVRAGARTAGLEIRASSSDDSSSSTTRGASTTPRASRSPLVAAASSSIDVIPGDYRIGGVLLGVAAFLGPVCHLWTQFGVHGVLGAFLAFQASRVRFRFSDTDLDVVFIEPGADDSTALDVDTESSGDNKLQGGGANKWSFESVTNWEFWFPGFPVLVYYKENQTRPEGQPHFFPIIMDGKKLYETMLAKMPASVNPKPDPSEWNLDTAFEATKLGRTIKENLDDEQIATLKKTKGFPGLDKE